LENKVYKEEDNKMSIIDLHIHTTMSDGSLTPKQVIDEACKNGVSTISICDHDTIEAYTDELFEYAKNKKINIIQGVEISTKSKKVGIHVLGYNYNLNDRNFKDELRKIRNARHDYLYNVSEKLKGLGYFIDFDDLDKIDAVTKAHIALNIINKKKNEPLLIKEFTHIPSKGEFIEKIMNENCPAYVEKKTFSPKEAANIIRNAGGKVVLAHPVAYVHEDNLTDEDIKDIIEEMRPNGIEANYLYVNYNNDLIDETQKWNKFAKDNGLFVTVGSDFHNKDGYKPEIGFVNTKFKLNQQSINLIMQKLGRYRHLDLGSCLKTDTVTWVLLSKIK